MEYQTVLLYYVMYFDIQLVIIPKKLLSEVFLIDFFVVFYNDAQQNVGKIKSKFDRGLFDFNHLFVLLTRQQILFGRSFWVH